MREAFALSVQNIVSGFRVAFCLTLSMDAALLRVLLIFGYWIIYYIHVVHSQEYDPSWKVPTFETEIKDGVVFVNSIPRSAAIKINSSALSSSDCSVSQLEISMLAQKISMSSSNVEQSSVECRGAPLEELRSEWTVTNISQVNRNTFVYLLQREQTVSLQESILLKSLEGHCWHVSVRLAAGYVVERDYTPISSLHDYAIGKIALLVKVTTSNIFSYKLCDGYFYRPSLWEDRFILFLFIICWKLL